MREGGGKGYRFVGHTADIAFVANGRTPADLLRNSLLAMFDAMAYQDRVRMDASRPCSMALRSSGSSLEETLWKLLQAALSHADAKNMFPYAVESISCSSGPRGYKARAVCKGREKKPDSGKFDVKGVSRFGLVIREIKSGLEARVVLDV